MFSRSTNEVASVMDDEMEEMEIRTSLSQGHQLLLIFKNICTLAVHEIHF